jgi:hypothetical protein
MQNLRDGMSVQRWWAVPVVGVLAVVVVLVAACRPDMAAWRGHLAEPVVARLDGAWTIDIRADSGEYGHEVDRARTVGALALVLNRERVTTSLFGAPPVAFGTYDIQLDTLGVATGEASGTPDIWVDLRGDSIVISLSPTAKWPIALVGFWRGDSVVGRWRADQRAGPSGIGDFVLRRR